MAVGKLVIDTDMLRSTLIIVGILSVARVVIQAVRTGWNYMRPSTLPKFRHSSTGSWALVTGASDGIGRAFSDELLRRGFNVLLHGRNPIKLERVRKELAQQHPSRSIDIVTAEASAYDTGYNKILAKVQTLPGELTVLVNNLGGVVTRPQNVAAATIPHQGIDATINVNARFPTHLTRALLPTLQKTVPSLIINCGSAGGLIGTPYLATYSATKAYIHAWTISLQNEMVAEETEGIEVVGFLIGNVHTPGNAHIMPFFTLTAHDCAASCLDQVGNPSPLIWSNWRHALQASFSDLLPRKIVQRMVAAEMKKRVEMQKKDG